MPLAVASATLLVLAATLQVARPAAAVEAWDGRIQAHGYGEMQVRAISEDFSDDLDLTQWYNIFDLELEADLLDEPLGPIDQVGMFVRAEVRFDCVWTRACGIFPSANTYGDRAAKVPRKRLADAVQVTTNGAILIDGSPTFRMPGAGPKPEPPSVVTSFATFAEINPVSFDYIFQRFLDFRFIEIHQRNGREFNTGRRQLGPWLPKNFIQANATMADRANPFDASQVFPAAGNPGAGALPFRPIPTALPGQYAAAAGPARGIYIPSAADQREVATGGFQDISHFFNFRQAERQWNRGQSQQQTKELKEAYFDIEMFESQLWMRIGRQNIVWGKTELFRTTDQFNPTDLALASLPSLEESRIPLWSARFVWNFWSVPLPVEDLRFEFAFNFDRFQGTDLGACGEPYTPNPVCEATFGVWAHGITGLGILGVDEPERPWKSLQGWELGGRVEFRYDRFSFAFMDFWGFEDTPYTRRVTTYERNVDMRTPHPVTGQPGTGAPRALGTRGSCALVLVGVQYQRVGPDCLQPGPTQRVAAAGNPVFTDAFGNPVTYGPSQAGVANNALTSHHANNQLYTLICSTTIGFSALDPASCSLNVFGSPAIQAGIIPLGTVISGVLAGFPGINGLFAGVQGIVGLPVVALTDDDALLGGPGNAREVVPGAVLGSPEGGSFFLGIFGPPGQFGGLSGQLTPEQEALLGCGPFWGVNCDDQGIDLLNSDASALLQSFVGFEGTGPSDSYQIPVGPGGAPFGPPQPGHANFVGGPFCTTGDITQDGRNDVLPGCRTASDPFYDQRVDGSTTLLGYIPTGVTPTDAFLPYQGPGAQNPLNGQAFQSEMAALSWNFLMLLVASSTNFDGTTLGNAFSTAQGQCSYVQPQFCSTVQSIWAVATLKRNTVAAGGNYSFGRRTFVWHAGGDAVLEFNKRNVLGFSMDVAEDRTKSNWSVEFTWINGQFFTDNNAYDNVSRSDTINLTISADRPTFINFLNANRTFLFNTQWFFQYIPEYKQGFTANGPWNFLFTFAVQTGYFQDRLLPSFVVVYDVQSASGAFLPQIGYRFNEAFSLTLGMALFMGHEQLRDTAINPLGGGTAWAGQNAYKDAIQNGLAAVRDRDEIFFRLRYTF